MLPFPIMYESTPDNKHRWELSVKAAQKAMNLPDDYGPVVQFHAHVFFRSDMPTSDSDIATPAVVWVAPTVRTLVSWAVSRVEGLCCPGKRLFRAV